MNKNEHGSGSGQPPQPLILVFGGPLPPELQAIISELKDALTSGKTPMGMEAVAASPETVPPEPDDCWFPHAEAADYLGTSESTLYQYASQGRLECRKLFGRLEYRRSTLDKFKESQVRPARRPGVPRSRIPLAHGSGK